MKILILSCNTGEGHNGAARAIAKELEQLNIEFEIRDPVGFKSDRMQKAVSDIYNDMIKVAPKSFGKIYDLGKWYSDKEFPSPIYRANSHYAPELQKYIEDNNFDAVICTHLYGMEAMTAILDIYGKRVPTFSVMTDYTMIPFMKDIDMDCYFVPHEAIVPQLLECDIEKDKIYCTGIPVNRSFYMDITKEDARKKLNLPLDKKIVMIMMGGVGCSNGELICDTFYKESDKSFYACFLAGHNEELKTLVTEKYNDKILAVGFTNEVPLYMKAADALITKAGGLSSTEAAVANIPIVHMFPIPGCETENAKLFMTYGMSLWAKSPEQAVKQGCWLAQNQEAAEKMKKAQREQINPKAAEDIVKKVIDYVTNK